MGQKIGSMYYDVEAKTDKLKSGLDDSKASVKSFGEEFKSSFTEAMSKIEGAKFALDTFTGNI